MEIIRVGQNKKKYLDLLLLADEKEAMVDRYLDRGTMYVLYDDGPRAVCVVTDEGSGVLELKNLAVDPAFHRMGYGRRMIRFLTDFYRGKYTVLQVGTGDSPATIPFYEACGFVRSHVIRDFFTHNYDFPIWEQGVLLRDMVYLRTQL